MTAPALVRNEQTGVIEQRGGDPLAVADDIIDAIADYDANRPRSIQTTIGPSEIGTPCDRRLAHKLAGTPSSNDRGLSWRPFVGTSVHVELKEALRRRDPEGWRWQTESTVYVGDIDGQEITGHCDVYDAVTATVIDYKVVGPTTLRDARANGPRPAYRVQVHTYGRGWALRGFPVDTVAILYLPAAGEIRDRVFWHTPYDESVALAALARADRIAKAVRLVGIGMVAPSLPTVDDYCEHCPIFRAGATDLTRQCPGASTRKPRADSVYTLAGAQQPRGNTQ